MKGRGKLGSVRLKLESVLKNYGVDRSKYFGADLIGTMVQSLFSNAKKIFKSFKRQFDAGLLSTIYLFTLIFDFNAIM